MKTFPTSAAWCFGILFISVSLITTGSSEVVGLADPVVALAGDDVILPCFLKPSVNAEDMVVEWTELYLKEENVHLYRERNVHLYLDGRDSNVDQSTSYRGRTSMFHEELKNSNVSLKLTRVTLSDAGRYRCFIPTLTSQVKETTVQLFVESSEVVGSADPVVALAGDDVILPCSLKPSVSAEDMTVEWTRLDLKATENVHLYRQGRVSNGDQSTSYKGRTSVFNEELKNGNVSLKLTRVTLSDAGRYRCFLPTLTSQVKETTVQLFVGDVPQPVTEINLKKETEIHVPDDVSPKSQVGLIVGLIAAAVVVLAASIGVYKWRKHTADPVL